ncbi:MAG: electron transport complex subunit RsxC [Gammaproteobacteria bacterium]|nr:electron transport complex subunit RsxC [Gammaproteobacteria bacterium]
MRFPFSNTVSSSRKSHGTRNWIQPEANKASSLRSVIMETPIPDYLYLALKQYNGLDARPIVNVGDKVLKGQKIAEARDEFGVPVHAPTSGMVAAISRHPYPDEFGSDAIALCIKTDGLDRWIPRQPEDDLHTLSAQQLIKKIREAGIISLAGSGEFPNREPIDTLIINGAECEPYVTCNQALIREHPENIISGAKILLQIYRAKHCIIAIEENSTDAIDALKPALEDQSIELNLVPARYPASSDKQLIQVLTKKEVPASKRPEDIGVSIINAAAAAAIHNAIISGEPLISRVTTVCGDTLKTPKNFRALIGTPVAFLFELCGIDYSRLSRVVMGGSLTGITLNNLDTPLIKTSDCLIAGSSQEFPSAPTAHECIRCGFCSSACPVGLMPQQLYNSIRAGMTDKAQQQGLDDCIECGACAYICPSHIPLVQYYRYAKFELKDQNVRYEQSRKWQRRFEYRQHRLLENEKRKQGNRHRSLARPEIIETTDTALENFSREQASIEIADAVARVKARKNKKNSEDKT